MSGTRAASGSLIVGLPGPGLEAATLGRLSRLEPAGILLFGRNLESPSQTATLLATVAAELPSVGLLAIDQEGGRVSRLGPWIGPTPPAARLAREGVETVREFARATGAALRALGFNLDLAPVVDLSPADVDNGIGDRAFGTSPGEVVPLARAYLGGLAAAGVAGCLKHFPGLGATTVDSHRVLPVDARPLAELERHDVRAFAELLADAPAVMVGHGHYPALDPGPPRPASCSPAIVGDLLRGRLGFAGPVVSDDLEMGAVAGRDLSGEAAIEAIEAGCDLLIYGADLDRAEAAAAALAARAGRSRAFAERLARAAGRVATLAAAWPTTRAEPVGWERAAAAFERFRRLV